MEELPTHIPTPEEHPAGSWSLGALLSVLAAIFLAYILRLAVPNEDNAIELGILLIAVGFAQIWLIFNFLNTLLEMGKCSMQPRPRSAARHRLLRGGDAAAAAEHAVDTGPH